MKYKVCKMGGLKYEIKNELVAVFYNLDYAKKFVDEVLDGLFIFDENDKKIYPLL